MVAQVRRRACTDWRHWWAVAGPDSQIEHKSGLIPTTLQTPALQWLGDAKQLASAKIRSQLHVLDFDASCPTTFSSWASLSSLMHCFVHDWISLCTWKNLLHCFFGYCCSCLSLSSLFGHHCLSWTLDYSRVWNSPGEPLQRTVYRAAVL